mgnify:CR=1 FL=1
MLAHLRGSWQRAAMARRQRVSGGSGGAIRVAHGGQDAGRPCEKNERTPEYVSRVVRGAVGEACAFLTRETPLHTVVCVVWCGPHVENTVRDPTALIYVSFSLGKSASK